MKLKIPPALTTVIFGFLMWGLNQVIHPEWGLFMVNFWIYRVVFGIGAALIGFAFIQFIRHQTTVDPNQPNKVKYLVDTGIYRVSRNPMYLAMLIWLAVFALKLENVLTLLLLPLFVIYMNRFQITPEEEALHQKFGDEYDAYKSKVRRWL